MHCISSLGFDILLLFYLLGVVVCWKGRGCGCLWEACNISVEMLMQMVIGSIVLNGLGFCSYFYIIMLYDPEILALLMLIG